MADIVIVTKQCYLICESINYITVREGDETSNEKEDSWSDRWEAQKRRKKMTQKQRLLEKLKKDAQAYTIILDFIPCSTNHSSMSTSRKETSTVKIVVRGYNRALDLFREMVVQIRDQQPDKLHLEKLVEKFLKENEGE